jgi:hypothetical protein
LNHEVHYTLEEANALLPRLRELIETLRVARDRLVDSEAHEALAEAAAENGGGSHGRTVGEAFLAVRTILGEIQDLGIVLRDLERGLLDFPSLREGREIYLCWQIGEDEVGWWHELEAGFPGRKPLDE